MNVLVVDVGLLIDADVSLFVKRPFVPRSMLTDSSVVLRYTGLSKLMFWRVLNQYLRYTAMPSWEMTTIIL